jgi:hypothetical protein
MATNIPFSSWRGNTPYEEKDYSAKLNSVMEMAGYRKHLRTLTWFHTAGSIRSIRLKIGYGRTAISVRLINDAVQLASHRYLADGRYRLALQPLPLSVEGRCPAEIAGEQESVPGELE